MRSRFSSLRIEVSVACVLFLMMFVCVERTPGESSKAWQSGTVIQVKANGVSTSENNKAKQYDISVQVGKKIYLTKHTMQDGEPDLELYVGMARMVLIDGQTLTFNDLLGQPHSLQIVSSKDAPAGNAK